MATTTIRVDETLKAEVPQYKPSPTFGLTGETYRQHLLEAKKRIEDGQYSEHELIEE